MNTLCLLEKLSDLEWIEEYWNIYSSTEDITIAVYSLEGNIASKYLKIPYRCFDQEAWKLNINEICDTARNLSFYWHQEKGLETIPWFEDIRQGIDYPVFTMPQYNLSYTLYISIYSYLFIQNIITKMNPDKVVSALRDNPFKSDEALYGVLGPDGGLEREAARSICFERGIPFLVPNDKQFVAITPSPPPNDDYLFFKGDVQNCLECLRTSSRQENGYISTLDGFHEKVAWPNHLKGKKILLMAYGDYYLEDIIQSINQMIDAGNRICLVIIGGHIKNETSMDLKEKGVCIFHKSQFRICNESNILSDMELIFADIIKNIEKSDALITFFSKVGKSFFQSLAAESIKKELRNLPRQILELLHSEFIVELVRPDVTFCHFARESSPNWGIKDVLPSRKYGIPTLSMSHGVDGTIATELNTSAAEYYCTYGNLQREANIRTLDWPVEKIFSIGTARFDFIKPNEQIQEAKRRQGFDPDKSLCIFCSYREIISYDTWMHSAFHVMKAIINLKMSFPELQIVYRVHHGVDCSFIKRFIDGLKISGLSFETSLNLPHPLFTEVVQAADFIISDIGSSITESLISGVQVIFISALSQPEPAYRDCPTIHVAGHLEALPNIVKEVLDTPKSRSEVIRLSQPFFDRLLCGLDQGSAVRLAKIIMELSRQPVRHMMDWQDWLNRIEASCRYLSGSITDELNASPEFFPSDDVPKLDFNQYSSYLDFVLNNNADISGIVDRKWRELINAFHNPDTLLAMAMDLQQRGNLKEAAQIYTAIIQIDPKNYKALHLLGVVNYSFGDYEVAFRLLSKSISINPNFAEAYNDLGCVLYSKGIVEDAVCCFQKALTIEPEFEQARINYEKLCGSDLVT